MDLEFSPQETAFRAEARAWLKAHVPTSPLASVDTEEGFRQHVTWEKTLFAGGWAVVSWPEAYGGRRASPLEWLIFEEEYYRAGAPSRVSQNGIFLLAPTLFACGSEEQRDRVLPSMARADVLWAQAWSEPEAGSDLAGIKSRGVRAEGGFLLSGQKTWCTRGLWCDKAFGLFRTDPTAPRHKGMTYFLFDLKAPGVTVRSVERLDGDPGFAEVFLENVFVPDEDVVGGVHQGWEVAMATTSAERGLTLRSPGRFLAAADRLVHLYQRQGHLGDPTVRDAVVRAWMDARAYRWHTYHAVTRAMEGESLGPSSSAMKVFWSELDVRLHETALRLLGPLAELDPGSSVGVEDGGWMRGFQFALAGPIYAGTNEIQRNILAERVLGLPRK